MSLPVPSDYAEWLANLTSRIHSGGSLRHMKHFAKECPDARSGQQAAAHLAWPRLGRLGAQGRTRLVAEPALSGIDKPMGIAEYPLVKAPPEPLDTCLPSIEALEAELALGWTEESEP